MQQLYFVRHGQTEWNAIRRMQGQFNSNLSDLGRVQADINGQLLAGLSIDAIFASPLDRTRQTADIINQRLQLPITFDDRIMEWDCGDWSGHMYSDVAEKWPSQWTAYQADPFNYRGPNCETYPDMIARSTPFLDELQQAPHASIAVVSHGMIGRVMVSTLLGHNESETLGYGQDNDMIFRLTLDEGHVHAHHYVGGDGPFDGLQPVPGDGSV